MQEKDKQVGLEGEETVEMENGPSLERRRDTVLN